MVQQGLQGSMALQVLLARLAVLDLQGPMARLAGLDQRGLTALMGPPELLVPPARKA